MSELEPSFLTSRPPSTLNMWEYEWALVCMCVCWWEMCVFICVCVYKCEDMSNLCEHAGVKARKRVPCDWERVNEGLRFMQSPYYTLNTQSVSLHIREQQRDPPIGCRPTPLPEHTHTRSETVTAIVWDRDALCSVSHAVNDLLSQDSKNEHASPWRH